MNKKKLIAGVMSLAIAFTSLSAFSAASVTSFAEGPVAKDPVGFTDDDTVTYPIEAEVNGGQYSVYEDHAVLTKCSDSYEGDFVIPAEVQGVPVTRIGERVFGFQKQIVSVTIPATVTEIGGHLAGYSTLQKYIVDENNKTFCSVDGVVFTKDMKTLVSYPTSYYTKTYTVPDGVETIGDGAAYNSDIESLILSDSVTKVDNFAFTYCKKLKSIKFTNSLKSIGFSGFGNCASLESADVPASVEKIDSSAFGSCAALKTLTINNPNCKISDFKPNDTVVIRGYEGSTAQAYAEKNELTFEALGGEPAIAVTTASTTGATTATATTAATTTATAATTTTVAETSAANTTTTETATTTLSSSNMTSATAVTSTASAATTSAATAATSTTTEASTTASATSTATVTTLGDANEDGSINAKDASFILAAYAKASTGSADGLSDTQRAAADVNADGKVDAKDASFILAYYSYLSTGGKDSLEAFLKK